MQELIRNLVVQFREFYRNLTPIRRVSLIGATVVLMMSALVTVLMTSGSDNAVLLRDVPADQVAVIVEKLQGKNIPHQVLDNGRVITVPKDLLHPAQITIMSEMGTSRVGNLGLELFDKQDFGSTSFAQKINFQRALQGELMRAINTLDAVKRSKVILAIPAKKSFIEDSNPATASVIVELHPGKALTDDQVKGITLLVANAVEGLQAERVSVVDQRGKSLARNNDPNSAGSSHISELKEKQEAEIERKVEEILERVVGVGKVTAKVNVNLDPRQTMTTEEKVDPDSTAVLAIQTEEEGSRGARSNPTGVPGARANLPGAQDNAQVTFDQNTNRELRTQNFVVPKTTITAKQAAGVLQSLSVAVLVDGVTSVKADDQGQPQETWTPRSAEEMQKFEAIVRSAVGFNEKRGDIVRIENVRFEQPNFDEADAMLTRLEQRKLVRMIFNFGLIILSLLAFIFVVIRPFIRWVTDSFQDSVEDMLPKTIEELEELQAVDNTLPGLSSALPTLEESLDPEKAESELLKERIMNLVERDEEKAAGAFSLWLVRKDG